VEHVKERKELPRGGIEVQSDRPREWKSNFNSSLGPNPVREQLAPTVGLREFVLRRK